jgi:uncharacterized membrane protein HdeD (DUF308 family)
MKNSDKLSEKIFLGFGIITIIAGIYLAFENPMMGIPGSIVGIWLTADNWKKLKQKETN